MPRRERPSNTHVQFPHLDNHRVTVEGEDGTLEKITRWELISEELQYLRERLIEKQSFRGGGNSEDTSFYISQCIGAYSPGIRCNFKILEGVFQERDFGAMVDLDSTIIFIIDAALTLPVFFDKPLHLLSGALEGEEVLELSKDQICSVLANAFFCTFPRRSEDLPRINFTGLFDDQLNQGGGWRARHRQSKIEKVKCFLNYFSQMKVRFGKDTGHPWVTYERRSLAQDYIPNWENCKERLGDLTVSDRGRIEDSVGSLQVEFANRFVGGGTLGNGAAMEEIRFVCCPELVASQLFTPVLGPTDVLLVHKYEQFTSHEGYGSTFRFAESYYDDHVLENHLVAMDAHHFSRDDYLLQFQKGCVDRELNKCLSAFHTSMFSLSEDCSTVASGKWGCGVFNGHPLLKCILQWMAASYSKKSLELYTFGDSKLTLELDELIQLASNRRDVTVGKLYSIILKYGELESEEDQNESLLQFIQNSLAPNKSPMMRIWKIVTFVFAIIVAFYWTLPVGIMSCLWTTNDVPKCCAAAISQFMEITGVKEYLGWSDMAGFK